MLQSFFRARPVLLALSATTWILGSAGCPGQLDATAWLPDAGFVNPPPPSPDTAPPPPPPMMVDAAPLPPPPKMDAPPPPPPMRDAGARADAPSVSDAPIAAQTWCKDAAEVTTRLLMPKCGACHGSSTKAGALDLISPGAAARLIDVPAAAAACRNQALVTMSPQVSGHFFSKLDGAVANCGDRMPLVPPFLSADEVQCLKDWLIAASAAR
jgi:hypothetical protein